MCDSCGEAPYMLIDGMRNNGQNTFQFGVEQAANNGSYIARYRNEAVPEPSTMLGLLAVGSLGAAIKRKKQQPERV